MLKSLMLRFTLGENALLYKVNQKARVKRQTWIITIFQGASYVLLLLRYVQSCDAGKENDIMINNAFDFTVDHYIYRSLKIVFLLGTIVLLAILRTKEQFKHARFNILLVILACLLDIGKEISVFIFVDTEQTYARDSLVLFVSLFYVDFLLVPALTYSAFLLRDVELSVLMNIGVFKDIFEMNDREMFNEYDKLRKLSYRVKEKYRGYR
jgi:hypothetical protein